MPAVTDDPPGTTLVLTKLRPPDARDLVPRPALVERLATSAPRRLTVVRAPAGWGKTTLLAAWASSPAEDRPFAWLALEPDDDQPRRFWRYAIAALRTVDPRIGDEALRLLGAPGVDLRAGALPALINDLAAAGTPVVLVLDDFHVITSDEIAGQLAFFVEHAPADIEVTIASRTVPALPLGRLRAHGALLEVDEALLRFSPTETDALLNGVVGLGLSAAQLHALHARTEGWAAGLYLAGLSLRDRADPGRFIAAFSGDDRLVVDYLAAEVLASVPEERREFLLRTSILDRLNGPLCAALTGEADATRVLRDLERSNLFLAALDDRRDEYRYHQLFADLLRAELEAAHPGLAPELHRIASAWLRDAGDVDRAIRHAVAGGDLSAAVELVAEHWAAWLLRRGEDATVDAWLRLLPEALVRADPRLCVAQTFIGHSLGRAHAVRHWLDAAEAAIDEATPSRVRGEVAAARASNALQTGDVGRAMAAARRALEVGDPASPWTPIPHGVLAHGRRWSGDAAGAAEAFGAWLEESERRGQLLGAVCSHAAIALIHAERGKDALARARAERALELATPQFTEHWVALDAHAALALLAARRGDGRRLASESARTIELAARGGVPADRANALLQIAELADAAGDRDDAADLVARAGELLGPCPDPGAMVAARRAAAQRRLPGHVEAPKAGDELSDRELAVLRLLPTDLSQREIGDELYVSLNTVKTHSRRIFRKLGASSREEAVARARDRGLLAG